LKWLNNNRIVYRAYPTTDEPTEVYSWGSYYAQGTYQCYELFRSKAKINTYKSLKWHLLVLWYLNPQLDSENFEKIARFIVNKSNNFITFDVPEQIFNHIIYEVSMYDLDQPPKNKLRKIIFNDFSGLETHEKLKIVGQLIGKIKKCNEADVYETMILLHDQGEKITIQRIADILNVSTRTIYRNMNNELNKEKELLNNEKI
jgi:hypothetical protein